MAQQQGTGGDPFELVDSKLTIYALANGMDLIKEPGVRRLAWYRDGREREVRIVAGGPEPGYSLVGSKPPRSSPPTSPPSSKKARPGPTSSDAEPGRPLSDPSSMDARYTPIACGLHDELQLRALRGRPVPLTVTGEDSGREVRLDRLVEVDGIAFGSPGSGAAAAPACGDAP